MHYIIFIMKSLFEHVLNIAVSLRNAGGRALLAGGCVRDHLAGRKPQDFDLEVYGLPVQKIVSALNGRYALDMVGASFGVMKVRHLDIDIALPRSENKIGKGHRGFIVETAPDMDFASASSRRDFTVNAMMMDVLTGEIIDPWGGQKDLEQKILRHVSEHFSEDPLRVLRGMQFIARFDFTAAPETVELCRNISQDELPRERLAAEWEKMLLKANHISRGLDFLSRCGWLKYYPELAALSGCPQDPRWHPEGDVWQHTLRVVDAASAINEKSADDKLILMLAALTHDLGKPLCTVQEQDDRITSCGHDTALAPAENFLRRLWNRPELIKMVTGLVRCHMQPWQLIRDGSSARAYRRLALHVQRMDLLADLVESDVRGIPAGEAVLAEKLRAVDVFRRRSDELSVANAPPAPLVLGRHLLARGIAPGKGMKPLLDTCFEAQLDGEFADFAGAMAFLDKLLCVK